MLRRSRADVGAHGEDERERLQRLQHLWRRLIDARCGWSLLGRDNRNQSPRSGGLPMRGWAREPQRPPCGNHDIEEGLEPKMQQSRGPQGP